MPIKLTKTEQKIYDESLYGYDTKVMAEEFDVQPEQICRHMSSIYKKMGVSNRVELMAKHIMKLEHSLRMANIQIAEFENFQTFTKF